jgi:hypothetical protein
MSQTADPACLRMDRYWNWIATPYFIVILLFGLYTIFSVSGPATSDSRSVLKLVKKIVEERVKKNGATASAAA